MSSKTKITRLFRHCSCKYKIMMKIYIMSCFLFSLTAFSQQDTLHIHYFQSNEVSALIVLSDNREGFAKAYSIDGKEIYSKSIRRFGGHESVEFRHFESGGVKEANYSSAPDGGIQWYKSTTYFDEVGNVTGFQENSHEQLLSPLKKIHAPVVPEVVSCASIHENIIVVHNHSRHTIEYIFTKAGKEQTFVFRPGEHKQVISYISAEITQVPNDFYTSTIKMKKNKRNKKFKTIIESTKTDSLKTTYHFHVFQTEIK